MIASFRSTLTTTLACGAVLIGCLLHEVRTAAAADPPSWQCLPEETLFFARLPNLSTFVDALKSRTKFGGVIANEERWNNLRELLQSESKEDWEVLTHGLDRLGLTVDDLWQATDGEIGYGGLLQRDSEKRAVYLGLAWLNGNDASAKKWLAALERTLQNQSETEPTLRRSDVDLNGAQVMHLTVSAWRPKFGSDVSSSPAPIPDEKPETKPDAAKPADAEKPAGEKKPAPKVETAQLHLLVHQRRNRILVGHVGVELLDGRDEPIKPSQSGFVERLRETFAKFIAAHEEGGSDDLRSWQETPGLAEAMPEGEPLVDVMVNLRGLTALLNTPETADAWKFVQGAGLEHAGPMAYRATLDGTVFRSGLFVAVPAPRQGLTALLDQTPLKPEPADWVANTAVGYQHFSIDLAKAFQTISRVFRADLPRGEGMLNTLDTQCRAFLQTDPATLLGAFGKTHIILTYLPKLNDDPDVRRANREDAAAQTAMALVWPSVDEPLFKRLMGMLSTAVAQPILVEQGFSGLRYKHEGVSAGWFIGNGYMTLALGDGVVEKVLSNMRSSARSGESMRATTFAQRAAELLPTTGTLTYDLTDGAGMVRFTDSIMQRAFADVTDDNAAKIKKIWPTTEELEGLIGVSVSATTVDNNGLTYRSALDLPAP